MLGAVDSAPSTGESQAADASIIQVQQLGTILSIIVLDRKSE